MTNNGTLLDIAEEILPLRRLVDASEGEMDDATEIALSELEIEANRKLLSVAAWIKTLDMEIEGVTKFRDEVAERVRKLKALKERLKFWIFKGARSCGIVTGDEQHGFAGEKVSSNQLQITWRRSKAVVEDEKDPGFEEMKLNFPHLYDYKIRVTEQGGHMLMDLIKEGLIEVKEQSYRASEAAEALKKKGVGIAGVKTVHRINPQIKG